MSGAAEYPAVKAAWPGSVCLNPSPHCFSFLVSAMVSYQTLGGFKQHAFVVLQFRKSEAQTPGVDRALHSLWRLSWREILSASSSHTEETPFLADGHIPPTSAPRHQVACSPVSPCVCIIRTIVTELSRILNAMAPKTLFPSKVTLTVSREFKTKTCLSKGHHSTLYTSLEWSS